MHEREQNLEQEIDLQTADSEGMFDVKLNKKIEERENVMYSEIVYRLVEQQTAEWEGMTVKTNP